MNRPLCFVTASFRVMNATAFPLSERMVLASMLKNHDLANYPHDLAAILNEGGTNYTVFLRSFEVDPTAPEASEILIREALGAETIVGEIKQVQCASVWPTIEAALTFTGDHNAGPSSAVFSSEVFQTALARTRNQIEGLVAEATGIEVFWLRDGHPDYPVYWDFAFLVRKNAGAMILIGSSSD